MNDRDYRAEGQRSLGTAIALAQEVASLLSAEIDAPREAVLSTCAHLLARASRAADNAATMVRLGAREDEDLGGGA